MQKKITSSIIVFLILSLTPGCTQKKTHHHPKKKSLPQDLLYRGKPLSNATMSAVLGLGGSGYICREGHDIAQLEEAKEKRTFTSKGGFEEDVFEWDYIGTLSNGNHIVYGYDWPKRAMGKFSGLSIVKRTGNNLILVDDIWGGDRHSSLVHAGEFHDNRLTYRQHMTDGGLVDLLLYYHPGLKNWARGKAYWNVRYGEVDYLGTALFQVTFTPEGEVETNRIVSFVLAADNELMIQYDEPTIASLQMGEAVENTIMRYCYNNKCDTLSEDQLKEVILNAFYFTEDIT